LRARPAELHTRCLPPPPSAPRRRQALPAAEFRSDAACTAARFAPDCGSLTAGGAGGEGYGAAAAGHPRLAAGYADGCLRLLGLVRGGAAVLWSAVRHASPVVALEWHPTQPLLLSASRWAAGMQGHLIHLGPKGVACRRARGGAPPSLPRSLSPRAPSAPPRARDGAVAVTHADTSRLVASSSDLSRSATPLHALALSRGGGGAGLCAAAWLDRLVVFEAPWAAGAGRGGAVRATAEYRCPEVGGRGARPTGARRTVGACPAAQLSQPNNQRDVTAVAAGPMGPAGRQPLHRLRRLRTAPWARRPHTPHPPPPQPAGRQVPDALPPGAESRLAFLPGSPALLLFTSPCLGPAALLFDAAAGRPLRRIALPCAAASLAASPCGGAAAFGLEDGGVALLADPLGGGAGPAAALRGHARAVRAVAFAAGGRLVSGAGDAMWVWRPGGALGGAAF
jgi:hypothetical protein